MQLGVTDRRLVLLGLLALLLLAQERRCLN